MLPQSSISSRGRMSCCQMPKPEQPWTIFTGMHTLVSLQPLAASWTALRSCSAFLAAVGAKHEQPCMLWEV